MRFHSADVIAALAAYVVEENDAEAETALRKLRTWARDPMTTGGTVADYLKRAAEGSTAPSDETLRNALTQAWERLRAAQDAEAALRTQLKAASAQIDLQTAENARLRKSPPAKTPSLGHDAALFFMGVAVLVAVFWVGVLFGKAPVSSATAAPMASAVNSSSLPLSEGFMAGLNARVAWEHWFASLSGDARTGASFWAAQRSVRPPAVCGDGSVSSAEEWVGGCASAQRILGPVDERRRTDRQFWMGWNSYSG